MNAAIPAIQRKPEAQPQIPDNSGSKWLNQTWLEPRLVGVTLVALLASVIAERAGAPALLILSLNLTAYSAGGVFGLKGAIESLRERQLDVDLIMILAAVGAALINQWHEGAILLFLFSLSNVLQAYAIGRSRQAIKSLMKLYPAEAKIKRAGRVQVVKLEAIRVGDLLLIEPGERIPVDGIIREGRSTVDQAPITGESMPVEKNIGDKVFAGTLNQQGALDIEALQPASDTVLACIIKMVEEAQDTKAPTERFLEKFEQIYAGVILVSVALFIVIPPLLGLSDFTSNFYRAMVLMTVASPCALVISTPAAFISAIASAARGGVLFKGGAFIEALAGVKAIAFDKTGTLTVGKPAVTDVIALNGMSETEILTIAASVESRSEHPLAKAIVSEAHQRELTLGGISDFEAVMGRGVQAIHDGQHVKVGSPAFILGDGQLPPQVDQLQHDGKTVMMIAQGANVIGAIALADQLRDSTPRVVAELKAQGVKVAMLTGDNQRVAGRIGELAGVDDVRAELMPHEKVEALKALQAKYGAVAMVGDGVNDAPALATADVGIAMGVAGSDVALETADLVLMGDRLELIAYAIGLSKKARRVVWQNIAFSLAVIVMLILGAFVIDLPLPLGVLGHEGSTVIVVLSGLIQLLLIPEIQRRKAIAS